VQEHKGRNSDKDKVRGKGTGRFSRMKAIQGHLC